MAYTGSKSFAGRGTTLQYSTNPPSVPYTVAAELKNLQFSGSKFDLADVTNYQSGNFREWLPTLGDSGELSFQGNMIPNDQTELDIIGFFNNATLVTFQVILPPSAVQGFPTTLGTFTFKAFVQSIDRAVPHDKEASISGKLKITGTITFTGGN